MTRCVTCADPVIYLGPRLLAAGNSYCSEVCGVIYRYVTPGVWIDANELAPGGRLYDRPELWFEPES